MAEIRECPLCGRPIEVSQGTYFKGATLEADGTLLTKGMVVADEITIECEAGHTHEQIMGTQEGTNNNGCA